MRTIEELRGIAVSMGKPLEQLLYEMLTDAMSDNDRLNNIINELEIDKKVLDDLCMELEYRYTPITELRVMDIQDFINKRFDKLKELKEKE